jgi:hypothetical protein
MPDTPQAALPSTASALLDSVRNLYRQLADEYGCTLRAADAIAVMCNREALSYEPRRPDVPTIVPRFTSGERRYRTQGDSSIPYDSDGGK